MSGFSREIEDAKNTYLENNAKNLSKMENVSISQIVDEISAYVKRELINALKQGNIGMRETSVGIIFHKTVKFVSAAVLIHFSEAEINTIQYHDGNDDCLAYYQITVRNVKEIKRIINMLDSKLRNEKITINRKESHLSSLEDAKFVYQAHSFYLHFDYDIE